MQPGRDKVVVERIVQDKTEGGIVLPALNTQRCSTAKVIAVGPVDEKNVGFLNVGDSVLYESYGAVPFELNGSKYEILDLSDIQIKF